MKVLLIVCDGMRSDSLERVKKAHDFMERSYYTLEAQTVFPSYTLPCHMSLFLSVDPERHGTASNTYAPQVRPITGLCEVLRQNELKSAFFYSWGQLRDLTKPSTLTYSCSWKEAPKGYENLNEVITENAVEYLTRNETDFAFLYLPYPDEAGHDHGWMSEEYLVAVEDCWDRIDRIVSALPEDYVVIITADHGGHKRTHGLDLPEDMTIPVFLLGKQIPAGKIEKRVNIKDIAPTVTKLFGVEPDADWEGVSIL